MEEYLLSKESPQRVTGMMIYYYHVCEKKLWYFCNQLSMEKYNEDVMMGKVLDETVYQNEKIHINIDGIINIDFIKSYDVLHEIKKSKSIEEAGIWQVKYYLYYLKKRGVNIKRGQIDYPLLKKTVIVELSCEDERILEKNIEKIGDIITSSIPPRVGMKNICKKCAYYDLCNI